MNKNKSLHKSKRKALKHPTPPAQPQLPTTHHVLIDVDYQGMNRMTEAIKDILTKYNTTSDYMMTLTNTLTELQNLIKFLRLDFADVQRLKMLQADKDSSANAANRELKELLQKCIIIFHRFNVLQSDEHVIDLMHRIKAAGIEVKFQNKE